MREGWERRKGIRGIPGYCQGCPAITRRVELAELALDAMVNAMPEGPSYSADQYFYANVVDLLTNLRHCVEHHRLNFLNMLQLSEMRWEEARHGGRNHGEEKQRAGREMV